MGVGGSRWSVVGEGSNVINFTLDASKGLQNIVNGALIYRGKNKIRRFVLIGNGR